MLCHNCASIDLSKAPIPPGPDTPDHKLSGPLLRPRILHYDSYAGIIAATESCQLCALVVEGFDALQEFAHPLPKHSVSRSFIYRVFDLFPEQARSLGMIKFSPENRPSTYLNDGSNYCGVELYVGEGMVPGVPWTR
jgi:hypothetical protein